MLLDIGGEVLVVSYISQLSLIIVVRRRHHHQRQFLGIEMYSVKLKRKERSIANKLCWWALYVAGRASPVADESSRTGVWEDAVGITHVGGSCIRSAWIALLSWSLPSDDDHLVAIVLIAHPIQPAHCQRHPPKRHRPPTLLLPPGHARQQW